MKCTRVEFKWITLPLREYNPETSVGCVHFDDERERGAWMVENGSRGEAFFEVLEGLNSRWRPLELILPLLHHAGKRAGDGTEVSVEPAVEIGKPQKSL